MKSKTEMIAELRGDIDLLIEANQDLVKQMSGLVKQQAAMEKRLDALTDIGIVSESAEQFQSRMATTRKAS